MLVDLKHTHARLLGEYRVEAAPGAAASDYPADYDEARAVSPLSLPPLNMLSRQHNLTEEGIGAGCALPTPSRITAPVMRAAHGFSRCGNRAKCNKGTVY